MNENLECFFIRTIKPKEFIHRGTRYNLENVDFDMIINGFSVVIDRKNENIIRVKVDGMHPNVNPFTHELCLPEGLYGKKFDDSSLETIIDALSVYNLDNCYFTVWDKIKPFA